MGLIPMESGDYVVASFNNSSATLATMISNLRSGFNSLSDYEKLKSVISVANDGDVFFYVGSGRYTFARKSSGNNNFVSGEIDIVAGKYYSSTNGEAYVDSSEMAAGGTWQLIVLR